MESPRGHATAFQQQQYIQMQNQQYQQQQKNRRQGQSHQGQGQQSQDYMSVGSHYSRDSTRSGASSSQVDEAYRRLGRRLSLRAHGDEPIMQPQRLSRIGLAEGSMFAPYGEDESWGESQEGSDETNAVSSGTTTASAPMDRTAKVARKRYSDHGNHHHSKVAPRDGNVLRKMTINATELFRLWQSDASRRNKKRLSPKTSADSKSVGSSNHETGQPTYLSGMSPHRFAFSQLALDGTNVPHSLQHPHDQLPPNLVGGGSQPNERGLSAVMESQTSSQTSSQCNTPTSHQGSMRSRDVSLASKADVPVLRSLPQGKCLTQPSEPVSNKGLDNSEGNLIVHENDAISVSRSQIHVLSKEKMNVKRADFRIQGLLGQGTFAHVFQCLHVQTGNLVAIKIVKNKQAYTRQAAVEIDVFRALTKGNVDQAASVSSRPDTASVASRNGEEKSQHMVDLICYFMHQNHLCLVFELLGLNLYDVLKKRQFRGLPLSVVRILAKQAVLGIKELAKKNIVHCDLKPENILLISDDDVDSVVSAGESRRSSSRSLSSLDKKPNMNQHRTTNDPPTSTTTNDKAQGSLVNIPSSGPISQSPSNSLGTNGSTITAGHSLAAKTIKLIDFGSACFEGQSTHTYIQSRFYRSPEVLLGLPYDSAIDMWSLGCVAAELFLGLPILPGVHEHDQLSRICEMISCPSDWMLEQGSSASKFFIKQVVASHDDLLPMERPSSRVGSKVGPKWRVRTQQEYIQTLSQSEIKKKGGLAKLEKQPANRYFKRKHLADIVAHKGQSGSPEDRDSLDLFVHFLYGLLDPDPWKRWTALQAVQHPFLTGGSFVRKSKQSMTTPANKDENQANILCDIYWEAPWDPNVCRRKLLSVQKNREKQQATRRGNTLARSGPPRPSSANSHDKISYQTEILEDQNAQQRLDHQQGLGQILANQVAGGQVSSSSYTDYFQVGASRGFGTDAGSVVSAGQKTYASGPMSYNEAGYPTGFLQNSFSEVDFAYALQRPGVVPMGGESISSSVDLSAAGRSQQHHMAGTHAGNQRNLLPGIGSRSYGEMGDNGAGRHSLGFATSSVGTAPGGLGHQLSASMQLADTLWQQAPGAVSQQLASSLGQHLQQPGTGLDSYGHQGGVMTSLDDPRIQSQLQQQDPTTLANSLQHQLAYDHAQVYLQQQHLALQQQQMMLQQQQAALALQQQQLQAYGFTPGGMVGGGAPGMVGGGGQGGQTVPNAAGQQVGVGMNQYGNGSYYYVTAADGTQMMVSAAGLQYQQGAMDPRYYQDPRYQQG